MKDVFDAYKQQKLKKNITIVSLALVFAIGVNAMLFSAPARQFQAAVTGHSEGEKKVVVKDVRLEAEKSVDVPTETGKKNVSPQLVSLVNSTGLTGVRELRASFLYDPNIVTLGDFFSENKDAQIIKIANEPGVITLNVRFSKPADIAPETKIIRVGYEKKGTEKAVVSLAETAFVTDAGNYHLTNAATEF